VYPLGTWKNKPPPRLTNLATTSFGPLFGTTGTSLIVPSVFGSEAKTCPGFTLGSQTRWRSSTVMVFRWGNSRWSGGLIQVLSWFKFSRQTLSSIALWHTGHFFRCALGYNPPAVFTRFRPQINEPIR
jgi:hypothetical protein